MPDTPGPRTVAARDANQRFSRLLGDVEAGGEVLITKRGQPVAWLVPATSGSGGAKSAAASDDAGPGDGVEPRLRTALIETCQEMNRLGLNQGTSGNASVRTAAGLLITPSGMAYDRMAPADIVHLDPAGGVLAGRRKPSSEWHFHVRVLAARPDVEAIVHLHSPYSTTLTCLGRAIPSFHYMVAVAGGADIRLAPYATFGTEELAENVVTALEGRYACLMANHGLLVLGFDLADALARAVEVEALARQYVQALSIGEPNLLGLDEMDAVLEKFRGYWRGAAQAGSSG